MELLWSWWDNQHKQRRKHFCRLLRRCSIFANWGGSAAGELHHHPIDDIPELRLWHGLGAWMRRENAKTHVCISGYRDFVITKLESNEVGGLFHTSVGDTSMNGISKREFQKLCYTYSRRRATSEVLRPGANLARHRTLPCI